MVDEGANVTPEAMGRAGWMTLHTFAAAYPRTPEPEDQQRMAAFIDAWSHLYPCKHCAAHMRDCIEEDPPKMQSREALSVWMCELHNKVNEVLDKPQFDCSLDSIMQRWAPGYRKKKPSKAGPLNHLDCESFCPEDKRKF
uniref:Sulfhydryl oxidase n=1 Tax=Eutreptiella gymnastica TaxID=73025 RepID=A0A7S1JFL3_9EUGL|mmetsp:Transcript_91560/g.158726  ORF Transcript_91560/g.158726 Transcript_91560/m.158726 type:complete len:140 (+) Transcript_91560:72-491(+)